jgi:glycosyltransferase involved in cell wall biosynthesis
MRILLVHNRYRSDAPSGENRVVDQEGEALAALGHEVIGFGRSSDEIGHWPAAKKAALPARTIWSRETYRDLRAVLRERRPDVAHVHNTFPLLSSAVLYACRDARVPVVATIHNYRLVCANGMLFRGGTVCHDCADGLPVRAVLHGCYRGSAAASAVRVVDMTLHRQAWRSLVSAYVLISASQRDLLRGLALPPGRVFVRYNLIPLRGGQPMARTPTVVYAGRLHEVKGVRLLMAGWDRYRSTSGEPGLGLVIVGGGPLQDEVEAWASSRPSVEMAGTVSADLCAEIISRARAVLLPSAWEETFGLVAVEAMAAGVPPIAAAHGSFTELITPGVDGVLFRPGDPAALAAAIADVEADPGRYEAYGDRARGTYAQRFDPRRSVAELLAIYRFAVTHPVWQASSAS